MSSNTATFHAIRARIHTLARRPVVSGYTDRETEAFYKTLKPLAGFKTPVPDRLHFIWIGDSQAADWCYLPVWQGANADKSLYLWIDTSTSRCASFQQWLQQYAVTHPQFSLMEWQNQAFEFIFPRITHGEDFNSAVYHFMTSIAGTSEAQDFVSAPDTTPCIDGVQIRDINTLFTDRFQCYKKLYYYEVILRGNLAAASDIIRLLVLYQYGGMYIDLDTLPDISTLFSNTCQLEKTYQIENDELICLAKSAAFMAWFYGTDDLTQAAWGFIKQLPLPDEQQAASLLTSIQHDLGRATRSALVPLGPVNVYQHFLAIGSLGFLEGVYFNNILCAHAGSRALKIILQEIKKRYRIIEKHNALYTVGENAAGMYQRAYLLDYRRSDIENALTLALTGPGLILEVIIGMLFALFSLDDAVSPRFISQIIQNDEFGLAFTRQTLDTPMGLKH